jgi:hypothetical protein
MDILNPGIPFTIGILVLFLDLRGKRIRLGNISIISFAVAFFILYYLFWYQGDFRTAQALTVTAFLALLPAYLFKLTVERLSDREQCFLIGFIIVATIAVLISTNIGLLRDPNLARNITGTSELRRKNIAVFGYSYAFGSVFVLQYILLSSKLYWNKSLMIGSLLLVGITVLRVQYTTMLLEILGCIMLCYYFRESGKNLKALLLILIATIVFFKPGLYGITIILPDGTLKDHIIEIYNFFVNNDTSGVNLTSRHDVYSEAWRAFLSSPINGIPVSTFSGVVRIERGHSEFLVFLACSGLIGFTFIHMAVYKLFHTIKSVFVHLEIDFKLYLPIFCYAYMCGWLNNFLSCYEMLFMSMYFSPLAIVYLKKLKTNTRNVD